MSNNTQDFRKTIIMRESGGGSRNVYRNCNIKIPLKLYQAVSCVYQCTPCEHWWMGCVHTPTPFAWFHHEIDDPSVSLTKQVSLTSQGRQWFRHASSFRPIQRNIRESNVLNDWRRLFRYNGGMRFVFRKPFLLSWEIRRKRYVCIDGL